MADLLCVGPSTPQVRTPLSPYLERAIIRTTARSVYPNSAICFRFMPHSIGNSVEFRGGRALSRVRLLGEEASGPADGRETYAWTLASITLACLAGPLLSRENG